MGLLLAEQNVGKEKKLIFQELWDSGSQHKTSEISKNAVSGFVGLQDPGSRILDPGSWIQDLGSRIRDPGSWIQDPGSWTAVENKHCLAED